MRVLLLNSDWSPLNFVSITRALSLVMKGRAEVICLSEGPSFWDLVYSTPSDTYKIPATLRLVQRVNRKYLAPRFRKHVLFNRDGWSCQYCGTKLDWHSVTVDHIVPRSKGGGTSWKNCVAACKRCNMKKGNRALSETGMQLRKQPLEPKVIHFWEFRKTTWHPDWSLIFGNVDTYRT